MNMTASVCLPLMAAIRQVEIIRNGSGIMYKILVADDEPDVLSLLKDYFEMNGYEVITAKNGREAVENMKKCPDMVLLDVNMPDGDGLCVCRQVRDYVSCPILFLTARIEDSDKIEGDRKSVV